MFGLLKKKINEFVDKLKITENVSEEPTVEEKTMQNEIKKPTKVDVGIKTKIKSKITGKIQLNEKEVEKYVSEFEMSLLEADVAISAAEELCNKIKKRLIEKKFESRDLEKQLKKELKELLLEELKKGENKIFEDIVNKFNEKKLAVILFVGPNGAGKTTTIAKIADKLNQQKIPVIIAAGDTWRAASQEQSKIWADKIGVKVFGGAYGSDPAAIGWKAIDYATKNPSIVLIDSAGRQSTNINLMKELEKIKRVNKPDLTIYIGEAITGNSIVDQIKEFDDNIKVDGAILTKMDVDEKGGAIISVIISAKKPVYLLGMGQKSEDLKEYIASDIVDKIIGE